MFNKILSDIESIVPAILSIAEINDELMIEYNNYKPTTQELNSINSILAKWPLEKARYLKLQELDIKWKQVLENGWSSLDGYRLGIDTQDITLLNGIFTLAKEAASMGMTDPVSIVDLDGESHSLSLENLTLLMLQYGQARAILSNSYATIKKNINSANTIEELDSINLTI